MDTLLGSSSKRGVVAGSINCDTILKVDRMAEVGETIKADSKEHYYGGKGAN